MSTNPYIVVEGLDGIGKTELCASFAKHMKDVLDLDPLRLWEPGTTFAGIKMRETMKDSQSELSRLSELFMMMASRSDIIEKHLLGLEGPVLSDRCWLSTAAYQITACPQYFDLFLTSMDVLAKDHPRGILFILDGTVELVKERNPNFGKGRDPIENASDELWRRRERMYHYLANPTQRNDMLTDPTYPEETKILIGVERLVNRFFKAVIRLPAEKSREEVVERAIVGLETVFDLGFETTFIK